MAMGQYLSVRFPDELLKALDAFAKEHNYSRSGAMRLAVWQMLNAPEPYIAPALSNWQVEAWTALLRGLFGVEHLVLTLEIRPLLEEAVGALNERQRRVLELRFGLDGPRHTLAEVAAITGVTRGRIYQIEVEALRHVRGWCRVRGMWKLTGPQLDKEEAERLAAKTERARDEEQDE